MAGVKRRGVRVSILKKAMPVLLFIFGSVAENIELAKYRQKEFQALQVQLVEYGKNGQRIRDNNRETVVDTNVLILENETTPSQVVFRRASALLRYLAADSPTDTLEKLRTRLNSLETEVSAMTDTSRATFDEICRIRREIALQNPVLDFDTILFCGYIGNYGIIPNNDWGHEAQEDSEAGIYIASGYKTNAVQQKDILADASVTNGRYEGKSLSNKNSEWDGKCAYNSLDLDFDADRIVFSWVQNCDKKYRGRGDLRNRSEESTFHLFQMNLDGSNLIQLTDSDKFNDYHPCWLPNGRIAFISERRHAGVRCGNERIGGPTPIGTLYSVKDNGQDLICLSWHETSDLYPSVTNDGGIVYTRWDYIDRDFNAAHHMWICGPDGTDPRAPHGNYPLPVYREQHGNEFCANGHNSYRPWAEQAIRAIPESPKYMAVETGHHTSPCGQVILIDTRIPDDNEMSQIKTFFPRECFQRDNYKIRSWCPNCKPDEFGLFEPYPLNEDFYLAGHTDRVVLGDRFGNMVTLHQSSFRKVPVRYPRPLRKRERPPVRPTTTYQGERRSKAPKATISVLNVYESDFEWPEGVVEEKKVKELRIVQLIPQPWSSYVWRDPWRGYGKGSIVRAVLGQVPVEDDGSAYFEAPIEREIYFQAIDDEGMAIQSMRSGTYVHPGEHLSCLGCHEDRLKGTTLPGSPKALRRDPSKLEVPFHGSCPINYYQLAKPIFDQKCAPCHEEKGKGISFDYWSKNREFGWTEWAGGGGGGSDLKDRVFYFHATEPNELCSKHGGSRTIAGKFGAKASRILPHLYPEHNDVQLTDEERRRIIMWLDCGSMELSSYQQDWDIIARQRAGETVWPELDVDPDNPAGVQLDAVETSSHPGYGTSKAPSAQSFKQIHIRIKEGTLVFRNSLNQPLRFAIFQPDGRTVSDGVASALSTYSRKLEAGAAGVYFVQLTADGREVGRRKIILR